MFGIRDTRMLAKAIMQRWPVGEQTRNEAIGILREIAKNVSNSPRDRTSAVKALLAAEKQNQEDEHKALDIAISHDRLSQVAIDLGIDPRLIADGRTAEGRGIAGTGGDTGQDEAN